MIDFIVYGNTDYLDILQIQTDYLNGLNKILFINYNHFNLNELYKNYDKIIFYDNNDTYPKRISNCLEQISSDYILFIHDIDILLKYDKNALVSLTNYLKCNNFDRLDLKYCDKFFENDKLIELNNLKNPLEWHSVGVDELNDGIYLIEQRDIKNYIYNVNPSIWKTESFKDLLKRFHYKNYRTIEDIEVQMYSTKFKVFKMFSKKKLHCGYFDCVDIFTFLHITHGGKLLSLNSEFKTGYGQSYNDIKYEYINIINKYNLTNSNKW